MYNYYLILLSSLYQSNRPRRMLNMDLPKYLYLQNNNGQWGTQLDILFISIIYGLHFISVQWFGDALIDFNISKTIGLRGMYQFVLPDAPVIWVYLRVHTAPGFTGSRANHFFTLLEYSASRAENWEVLTFQPDQPHISIYLSRLDASPSSNKMVQSTLDVVLNNKNLENGKAKKVRVNKVKAKK